MGALADNQQTASEALAVGQRVELVMPARRGVACTGAYGVVEGIEDDGWIVWREDDGAMHATRPTSLRKQGPRR